MFKCKGICSECGRCDKEGFINKTDDRKAHLSIYPENFTPDTGMSGFGVAFDIGTTTVVGMLWSLEDGILLQTEAATNPQNKAGMDIISRINFCLADECNLFKLRKEICLCIDDLIAKMCEKERIDTTDIIKMTICGNTVMAHIIAGCSLKTLAAAPFTPAYEGELRLKTSDLHIKIDESAEIILIPNIAGYVGGDITAGVVASGLLEKEALSLYVDIGTNGEIVITDGKISYTCSTAAGPAFEGASIYSGMRAVNGAIEAVRIKNDDVVFKTIGGLPPQGICGSGIIDAVSQMLENGIIDKNGRLLSTEQAELAGISKDLSERLIEADGKRCFILVAKENGRDIIITQNDIREVQLAKGAIETGVHLLLDEFGKRADDIERVYIAGAFGNYINKRSAVRIGLLPGIDEKKIQSVGNAAGVGASMALVSNAKLEMMRFLPSVIQHVELAAKENFQVTYIESMGFM